MSERVLFLDVDGVLNSTDWFKRRPKRTDILKTMLREKAEGLRADHGMDPENIARLNTLVEQADCDIVISSTWRKLGPERSGHEHMQRMLKHRGFEHSHRIIGSTPVSDRVVGVTGIFIGQPRGVEIQEWLDSHGPVGSFVILDDETDMAHLIHRLVKTSFQEGGLLDTHVDAVLALLKHS
jgi:hypothetical protein